jgi:hypothetical protein
MSDALPNQFLLNIRSNPYSWNSVTVANGSHYLVCNGYMNGMPNGTSGENVVVSNSTSTTVATPKASGSPTPTSA